MREAAKPLSINAPVVRPDSLTAQQRNAVKNAVEQNRNKAGPLIPILHAVQDALGFVPEGAVSLIAHELNITRAEAHGVVSFYHYFRKTAPGRRVVYICRAEACQARGARSLEAHAKKSLGIDFHETTPDGAVSLEPVYCLGNCGCGPSVLVGNDELHANVTPQSFDALVKQARAGS